jgi:hypothetical protein
VFFESQGLRRTLSHKGSDVPWYQYIFECFVVPYGPGRGDLGTLLGAPYVVGRVSASRPLGWISRKGMPTKRKRAPTAVPRSAAPAVALPSKEELRFMIRLETLNAKKWRADWVVPQTEILPCVVFMEETDSEITIGLLYQEWQIASVDALHTGMKSFAEIFDKSVRFIYWPKQKSFEFLHERYGPPPAPVRSYTVSTQHYRKLSSENYLTRLISSTILAPGMFVSRREDGGLLIEMCWLPSTLEAGRTRVVASASLGKRFGCTVYQADLTFEQTIAKYKEVYPTDFNEFSAKISSEQTGSPGSWPVPEEVLDRFLDGEDVFQVAISELNEANGGTPICYYGDSTSSLPDVDASVEETSLGWFKDSWDEDEGGEDSVGSLKPSGSKSNNFNLDSIPRVKMGVEEPPMMVFVLETPENNPPGWV